MKTLKITFLVALITALAACGGGQSGSTDDVGTVEIIAGIGSGSPSISALTKQASADEVFVRVYRFSLGDSADCATANFTDIIDETSNTSDCLFEPDDTSLFLDIADSPTLTSKDDVPVGTYACARVTICDQLVWSASNLVHEGEELCPAPQHSDIRDPRDESEVLTFYYSIDGTFEDEDEDGGSLDHPFLLTDPVSVIAGGITTLAAELNNGEDDSGMIAEYDSENEVIYQCEIPAPRMTVTEQ